MCCFNWNRRAAERKKVVGWRSAEARMTAAKKKYLYGAMGGMNAGYCVGCVAWSASGGVCSDGPRLEVAEVFGGLNQVMAWVSLCLQGSCSSDDHRHCNKHTAHCIWPMRWSCMTLKLVCSVILAVVI